ncbi:putative aldolase class 2 protein CC_1201 [Lineus longissimus]|uniref:putative aldolase class 2 protein CC_1201 n=1 Tax=Lineus longissimus TaxID=88925 RepID=UPI00315CBB59
MATSASVCRIGTFLRKGGSRSNWGNLHQRLFPPVMNKTNINVATLKTMETNKELNQKGRQELAVAYRALERFGFHEGICNHVTLVVPAAGGSDTVMLLVPYGIHWSRVKASSLLALNDQNEIVEGKGKAEITAACIHRGVHDLREDAKCVIHTHAPYSTALALLKNGGLKMVHQNSCRFYKGVAYDDHYNGLAGALEEGERIADCMGENSNVLFMKNHGVMVTGNTVAEAFDRMYYLERACHVQVLAMSCGEELSVIPDSVAASTFKEFQNSFVESSADHFSAITDCIMADMPEVAD